MQMRTASALALFLGAVALTACRPGAPPRVVTQKMVILGFDGMDPRLVEQWMSEGKLPNFKKLAGEGGFYRLGTSTSPERTVAFSKACAEAGVTVQKR